MVMVSTNRIAILIIIAVALIAITTTAVAAILFANGVTRPTIASNVAPPAWVTLVVLVVGRAITRKLNALGAKLELQQALADLVTTGSLRRPRLRSIDSKRD